MFNDYDEDSDNNIYEKDESDNDDGSEYDNFWFENHSEYLIISYNVTHIFCCCLPDFLLWLSDSLRIYKLEKLKDCNQRCGTIWDLRNI